MTDVFGIKPGGVEGIVNKTSSGKASKHEDFEAIIPIETPDEKNGALLASFRLSDWSGNGDFAVTQSINAHYFQGSDAYPVLVQEKVSEALGRRLNSELSAMAGVGSSRHVSASLKEIAIPAIINQLQGGGQHDAIHP
ncbi:MAG: hypothetical protein IBX50_08610 [Marinospirillum sp.]|uniref:hypothetical protein n=1 Tax=Marinospirillum sp. TaxID=2183934 RepID=UPI0019F1D6F2|nr:hypothetical protein [Marinospirillum sp.]MBE0506768.1 hypothetical protein [Marinospirillum sp.]